MLDVVLAAVDVEQATDDHGQTARVDLKCTSHRQTGRSNNEFGTHALNVDFNVLHQVIAVQVQNEVMHEIESIADDDQRQLVGEFRFLQEVLDALGIVAVRLAADAFDLLDLAGLARRLDVLEVHVGLLTEVDDGAEEVEETCSSSKKKLFEFSGSLNYFNVEFNELFFQSDFYCLGIRRATTRI